jgi:hypothetical protein
MNEILGHLSVRAKFSAIPHTDNGSPLMLNLFGFYNSYLTIDKDGMVRAPYSENSPGQYGLC